MLLSVLLCLLVGCAFRSPEDLYAVPRAAEDYQNLQEQIDKVRGAGAEYAGPLFGANTQPVQLIDLDGDGIQEAVVFFRTTAAADSSPLKIYIYRQTGEGNYEVQNIIEGDGTAINTISYEDLDGKSTPDGGTDKELVVSWRLSANVYRLMAYSVSGSEAELLLPAVSYSEFVLWDMDKDNQKEIVVFTFNTVERTGQADYYDYRDGQMLLCGSAPMSDKVSGLANGTRPRTNYLRNGEITEPAIFVTSTVTNGVVSDTNGIITDIFAWRNEELVNITRNPATGMSDGTFRLNNNIPIQDINGDSYLEVPKPTALPDPKSTGSADFWSVQWMQYDLWGKPTVVSTTYYNGEDGWYLALPESWQGKISLSRRDSSGSGERGVFFYPYTPGEREANAEAKPFLAIYKLTGPNQATRARAGNRFILLEQDDAIYAAEFGAESGWDCGVDEEGLKGLFHLIQADWTSAL